MDSRECYAHREQHSKHWTKLIAGSNQLQAAAAKSSLFGHCERSCFLAILHTFLMWHIALRVCIVTTTAQPLLLLACLQAPSLTASNIKYLHSEQPQNRPVIRRQLPSLTALPHNIFRPGTTAGSNPHMSVLAQGAFGSSAR